jgi:hypothetical protein
MILRREGGNDQSHEVQACKEWYDPRISHNDACNLDEIHQGNVSYDQFNQ